MSIISDSPDVRREVERLRSELEQARADVWALSQFSRQYERERDEYKYQRDVITLELTEAREYSDKQHSAIVRDTLEIDALQAQLAEANGNIEAYKEAEEEWESLDKRTRADNADLRARLQAVTSAAVPPPHGCVVCGKPDVGLCERCAGLIEKCRSEYSDPLSDVFVRPAALPPQARGEGETG